MRLLLPAATVWSQFDYFSHPTHCCWQPYVRGCANAAHTRAREGKRPCRGSRWLPSLVFNLALLPSPASEGTSECIMIQVRIRVLFLPNTWACTRAYGSRHLEQIHTRIQRQTHTHTVHSAAPLELGLAAAYHGDRQLDCSWPLTCALCSSRSDFIVGNMRWVQERVHSRGKEALHTVGLHISVSPWAFSPDTAFSPSVVQNPPRPVLGFLNLSPPGFGAFQLGSVPGWSPLDWKEGKGRKMQRGPLTARSTMWALMTAAWMWCLPATDPCRCHSPATIWWSSQQPGEDASLTRHLDRPDKHWGWTDPALTPPPHLHIKAPHTEVSVS